MISKKDNSKSAPKYDAKQLERFNDALSKMSAVALQYQQGKLKHILYADQMDALIEASGWSKEDFHAEVERRRKALEDQK